MKENFNRSQSLAMAKMQTYTSKFVLQKLESRNLWLKFLQFPHALDYDKKMNEVLPCKTSMNPFEDYAKDCNKMIVSPVTALIACILLTVSHILLSNTLSTLDTASMALSVISYSALLILWIILLLALFKRRIAANYWISLLIMNLTLITSALLYIRTWATYTSQLWIWGITRSVSILPIFILPNALQALLPCIIDAFLVSSLVFTDLKPFDSRYVGHWIFSIICLVISWFLSCCHLHWWKCYTKNITEASKIAFDETNNNLDVVNSLEGLPQFFYSLEELSTDIEPPHSPKALQLVPLSNRAPVLLNSSPRNLSKRQGMSLYMNQMMAKKEPSKTGFKQHEQESARQTNLHAQTPSIPQHIADVFKVTFLTSSSMIEANLLKASSETPKSELEGDLATTTKLIEERIEESTFLPLADVWDIVSHNIFMKYDCLFKISKLSQRNINDSSNSPVHLLVTSVTSCDKLSRKIFIRTVQESNSVAGGKGALRSKRVDTGGSIFDPLTQKKKVSHFENFSHQNSFGQSVRNEELNSPLQTKIKSLPQEIFDENDQPQSVPDINLEDSQKSSPPLTSQISGSKIVQFANSNQNIPVKVNLPTSNFSNGFVKSSPKFHIDSPEDKEKAPPTQVEEMVSTVVHDMRSPLMCIQGNLELIEFEVKNTKIFPLVEPLLKSCIAASSLLETLVSDILDSARISKGIFKITTEELNLKNTIEECVETLRLAARAKNNEISYEFDCHTLYILSDEHRIKQVLLNFLSNSIKFTNNGKVTVIAKDANDCVSITVRDNGEGIKKENLSKLFEKFNSNRDARSNSKGIGLGLFICKSIIETLGPKKEIQVSSKPNVCTEITFEIFKNVNKTQDLLMPAKPEIRSRFKSETAFTPRSAHTSKRHIRKSIDIFDMTEQGATESKSIIEVRKKTIHMSAKDQEKLKQRVLALSALPFPDLVADDLKVEQDEREAMRSLHRARMSQIHGTTSESSPDQSVFLAHEFDSVEGLNILILDDDELVVELLSTFTKNVARQQGINLGIFSALSLKEAYQIVEQLHIDILATDLNLEDGTGPDFLRRYKEIYPSRKIPFSILVTGEEETNPVVKKAKEDYSLIMTKPLYLKNWSEALKSYFDKLPTTPSLLPRPLFPS